MGSKSIEKHVATRISVCEEMLLKLKKAIKKIKDAVTAEHYEELAVAYNNISDLMKIQEDYIERLEKELFVLKEERNLEIDDRK